MGAAELRAPAWAEWAQTSPFTLGVEEEVMLLDPDDWSLAQRSDDVLPQLPAGLADHVSAETHQAAVELATRPHATVGEAIAELRALRGWIAAELAELGLTVAGSGTHPFAIWSETRVSPASRYQVILQTMADLARREPTFALHVHVGVPDPERAVRILNGLRAHLPVLLGLAANSPFWQGRATGLASTRTPVFGMFPRTGIPRRFASYSDWVDTVDALLRCGAFPEPTFLWWDIRPQPVLGTVEVRVMDAQSRAEDTAALVALVQALARLQLEDGLPPAAAPGDDEVLAENRFLAARDGIEAELLDPAAGRTVPARALLDELLEAARPHADALACRAELELVAGLADEPGFARQLDLAGRHGDSLNDMLAELAREFAPPG